MTEEQYNAMMLLMQYQTRLIERAEFILHLLLLIVIAFAIYLIVRGKL